MRISSGSSSVTKYIARPARIASRVFGWPSTISLPFAIPSIVRSPPVASSITSRSGPPSSGSSSTASSSRIDDRPGPLVQQLVRAVDGRVEDPEAARARREHRLEADRPLRVAELARRGLDLARAVDPLELRRADAERVQQLVRLGLVVRAAGSHRGATRARGIGKRSTCSARPSRSKDDCGRIASTPSRVASSSTASGNDGIGARRHEVERVAEVPPDRALAHVGADEPHLALAVLAQRVQERGGAGRARGGDHDRDRLHVRSILSARRCSSRASRSASRNARIVSPIVVARDTPRSPGGSGAAATRTRRAASSLVRAAVAPVLVRVRAVVRRVEERRRASRSRRPGSRPA